MPLQKHDNSFDLIVEFLSIFLPRHRRWNRLWFALSSWRSLIMRTWPWAGHFFPLTLRLVLTELWFIWWVRILFSCRVSLCILQLLLSSAIRFALTELFATLETITGASACRLFPFFGFSTTSQPKLPGFLALGSLSFRPYDYGGFLTNGFLAAKRDMSSTTLTLTIKTFLTRSPPPLWRRGYEWRIITTYSLV